MLLSLVTKTLRSLQTKKNGLSEWKMFGVFLMIVSLSCWIWFYFKFYDSVTL